MSSKKKGSAPKPVPVKQEPVGEQKPITYEALMVCEKGDIERLFPYGAKAVGKKWAPARKTEKPDKPLRALLKDKKDRFEKPRYPNAAYSRSNYTEVAAFGLKEAGAAVPKSVQAVFDAEGEAKRESLDPGQFHRARLRSYMARIREVAIERINAGEEPWGVLDEALADLREDDQKAA